MSKGIKRIAAVSVVIGAVVGITAGSCDPIGDSPQFNDLEDVPVEDLQNVRIFTNVDGYTNMVVGCIEGVAFVFTTRDFEAVNRVPELDNEICGVDR